MANEEEQNISAVYDSVAVVIPALNEEESLPLVLGDLPQVGRVVVVDNGSTDDTAKLCLLYTSPSPRDGLLSRMPSSA